MKFAYTIIYVNDVELTLDFYCQAFNMEAHFLHESKQYGELKTGDTKLAFATNILAESNGVQFIQNSADQTAPGVEIALVSEDVQHGYAQALSAGATPVAEPTTKPWGQEVAYVRDINGIIIEICSALA